MLRSLRSLRLINKKQYEHNRNHPRQAGIQPFSQ